MFGSLVKGLRIGLNLLLVLQSEGLLMSSFAKVFKVPVLTDSCGLDQFLTQFEAAIESDFPNYQVLFVLIWYQFPWTEALTAHYILCTFDLINYLNCFVSSLLS